MKAYNIYVTSTPTLTKTTPMRPRNNVNATAEYCGKHFGMISLTICLIVATVYVLYSICDVVKMKDRINTSNEEIYTLTKQLSEVPDYNITDNDIKTMLSSCEKITNIQNARGDTSEMFSRLKNPAYAKLWYVGEEPCVWDYGLQECKNERKVNVIWTCHSTSTNKLLMYATATYEFDSVQFSNMVMYEAEE